MEEFVYKNAGGIFRSEDKDAVCITRIGVAAINVKRSNEFSGNREVTNRWMGQEKDRVRLAIWSAEQLHNLGPEGPRHIIYRVYARKKGNHNVFCNRMFDYIGMNIALLIGLVELLLGQNFIKLRRLRAFAFQNGQVPRIDCSQKPVCSVPLG